MEVVPDEDFDAQTDSALWLRQRIAGDGLKIRKDSSMARPHVTHAEGNAP